MVAGNLPFNVATRIIQTLLPATGVVPRAAFLVQKEVAERLVAMPGGKAYGSLSVLVRAWATPYLLGTVKPGSFHPRPKVAAAFVGFELHPPPLPSTAMPEFIQLIRLAFGQRRKTLRNCLAAGWGRELTAAVLGLAGLDPGTRAERLDLDDFVNLWRSYGQLRNRGSTCPHGRGAPGQAPRAVNRILAPPALQEHQPEGGNS